ncbi:GTP pyrophosphokinase family protein [Corynebacterium sp. CCM 9185]|uniref:GTP pyrophosphokinase family protein n=1 Tax=Corynebacterium marambiense TaxID=2765364 RepID=A0ABS0VVK0_9CORY|nr:GTP pyrophosphokinase family protein [Corynebacterium marambiense]MBI9000824.1 GTP pyrophosphokinase family protein [Corynebacterium marambiense]MCK7662910.1 GTP pyrophosphokinase family protein [Corynebacterium marambiense]MCX7542519.1 GTP pyrophosphokinase family protein [Corynebacterium marambiense]
MGEPNRRISVLGQRYAEWVRAHPRAAGEFRDVIEELLAESGVTYDRVSVRVKEWRSLKAKAYKTDETGRPVYPDPWDDIHDILGVRVTVYHSTEIPQVISVLREAFTVHRSVDKTAETRVSGSFGYGSHHLIVGVEGTSDATAELADYAGLRFEVQVRTVLQHAWAEFEHDIRYKGGGKTLDPRVDRAFTLTAGLIELADQQFDLIASIQGDAPGDAGEVELSAETLPGVLAVLVGNRFPRSKFEYYVWLEEILAANGITTVGELKSLLDDADIDAVQRSMRYQFTPGQVRIIDDLLLRRFGREHIERTKKTGIRAASRAARLKQRLKVMEADHIIS